MDNTQSRSFRYFHYLMLLVPLIFLATILYVSTIALSRTSGITGQDTTTFPILRTK